jgi:hypothetical protein
MVIQHEDFVGCLTALYPYYDFLSCGYDKQREDELNIERMLKEFGDKQAIMPCPLIKQQQGHLSSYTKK